MKALPIILLGIIVSISLITKIYSTDFNEPTFIDGEEYNQFAWNLSHGIRPLPVIHNIGFSLALAPIFLLIPNESSTELIQQLITISLSTLTLPVFYKLARRIFSWEYALIATALLAFEPHIIQNATFGITEPQYLFLFITSLYLVTSKNTKYQYMSFLVAGIATITRFEGFILLGVMIIIYLYQNKLVAKKALTLLSFLVLFAIPIVSSTLFNLDYGTGENVITAKVIHDTTFTNSVISHSSFMSKATNSLIHLGWSLYPMFIFLTPLGLYFLFKNKPVNPYLAIVVMGMLSISGLFAYLRAYDVRYFIPVYPILAIISSYAVLGIVKSGIIKKVLYGILESKSDAMFFSLVFAFMVILSFYVMLTPISAETLHVNLNNTVIVYPTFTLAAYDSNGFYSYYKGLCDQTCLTITDRFSDITQIKYDAYGLDTIRSLKIPMISDETLDSNPDILKKYNTVIILHNEYVTKKEFDAITTHSNVVYLYPNALYALIKRTGYNTITLVNGHNYPTHDIANGFGWKFDNSIIEYKDCKNNTPQFYNITNGHMLNCYPKNFINSQSLWSMVENFTKN